MSRHWRLQLLAIGCMALGWLFAQFGLWAHAADGRSPNSVQANYRVATMPVGSTHVVFRWKPDTGQVWRVENEQWVLIDAPDRPTTGDFEVVMAQSSNTYWVVLCDRLSGMCWELNNLQWQKVADPK